MNNTCINNNSPTGQRQRKRRDKNNPSDSVGLKNYELTDHLGNVTVTFLDRKYGNHPDITSSSDYYPFGFLMMDRSDNFFGYRFGFNGQESDNEVYGGKASYTAEFWQYDSRLGRRWNIDMELKFWESPYSTFAGNPILLIDPFGADTIDINKNDGGKWEISNKQIVEGNDIFRVTADGKTTIHTFSEGEYGKRINMLNLENNDNHTLGIFHISGNNSNHGVGYYVTPGGDASTKLNSNKRLPADIYTLGGSYNQAKWRQIWVLKGEQNGDVSERGVKFHFGYTIPKGWTKGCFIVATDYELVNEQIKFSKRNSRATLIWLDQALGATKVYLYDLEKYGGEGRIGAEFPNNKISHKLILKDGF
jgi:hypothetical protein